MISKLRKRHRLVTMFLSLLLPLLLFLALSARAPEPITQQLPTDMSPDAQEVRP